MGNQLAKKSSLEFTNMLFICHKRFLAQSVMKILFCYGKILIRNDYINKFKKDAIYINASKGKNQCNYYISTCPTYNVCCNFKEITNVNTNEPEIFEISSWYVYESEWKNAIHSRKKKY